jgi:hypothetical protein
LSFQLVGRPFTEAMPYRSHDSTRMRPAGLKEAYVAIRQLSAVPELTDLSAEEAGVRTLGPSGDGVAFRVGERTKGRIKVLSKGEALLTANRRFESLSLRQRLSFSKSISRLLAGKAAFARRVHGPAVGF